jgi:hypothetical protein
MQNQRSFENVVSCPSITRLGSHNRLSIMKIPAESFVQSTKCKSASMQSPKFVCKKLPLLLLCKPSASQFCAFSFRISRPVCPSLLSCPVLSCPVLSCPVLSVCASLLMQKTKRPKYKVQSAKRKAQSAKVQIQMSERKSRSNYLSQPMLKVKMQKKCCCLLVCPLCLSWLLLFFRPSVFAFFFRFRCRFFVFRPFVLLCLLAFCLAVRAVSLVFFVLLSPRLSSLDGLFKPQPNRASTFVVTVCPRKQISSSVCQFECFFFSVEASLRVVVVCGVFRVISALVEWEI